MKEKFEQLMKAEREMPRIRFAELLDIQPATLSHIMSDRNKPSRDLLIKILDTFPNVSAEWLMRNKGNMLINSNLTPTGLSIGSSEIFSTETLGDEQRPTLSAHLPAEGQGSFFDVDGSVSPNASGTPRQVEQHRELHQVENLRANSSRESNISSQLPVENILSHSQEGSQVERIVVFYADNTFKTYTPRR